ncbi:MAG TPA: Holliday junction resolvase RuvX [Phycisphaerales bacterium]|nr:Holliday junction resolvase RuvX [Phycisphaerales bacterium]
MRYLGIDLGERRTGIALGDSQTRLVTPVEVIEIPMGLAGGGPLIEAIVRCFERQIGPATQGELIFGLPLNMDGTESKQSRISKAFALRVKARLAREVRFQDERLTSADADWAMSRSDLTHKQKKERRDALAAAAILRDYLAALPMHAQQPPENPPPPAEPNQT